MQEKFPNLSLFNIGRFVYALGLGALVITGGGKPNREVVADYHPTKEPKKLELSEGMIIELEVVKHDGFQAVGKFTIAEDGKTPTAKEFALQKGQSLELTDSTSLLHEYRKK